MIEGAVRETLIVSVVLPVEVALVAEIVTGVDAFTVGVPDITPVEVLILNPAGNPVALKLVGELVPVIV